MADRALLAGYPRYEKPAFASPISAVSVENKYHHVSSVFYARVSQTPDNKVHGANMGPIRGRQDPGGPHVGPTNLIKVMLYLGKPTLYFSCDLSALRTPLHVRLSVRLSVCHTFFNMFLSSYYHDFFYHWQKLCPCRRSRSEAKGQGHWGQNPI